MIFSSTPKVKLFETNKRLSTKSKIPKNQSKKAKFNPQTPKRKLWVAKMPSKPRLKKSENLSISTSRLILTTSAKVRKKRNKLKLLFQLPPTLKRLSHCSQR